jgi:hypothetical protein
MALELRMALEDRLPAVAALAACWFQENDADESDGAGGSMDWPSDPVSLRIDLQVFASGLVRRDGRSATVADAEAFLTVAGFSRFGDLWIGDRQDLRLIGTRGVVHDVPRAADA